MFDRPNKGPFSAQILAPFQLVFTGHQESSVGPAVASLFPPYQASNLAQQLSWQHKPKQQACCSLLHPRALLTSRAQLHGLFLSAQWPFLFTSSHGHDAPKSTSGTTASARPVSAKAMHTHVCHMLSFPSPCKG